MSAAGGLLLLLAFPPFDAWWAAAPGLALLAVAARRLRPVRAWLVVSAGQLALFLPLLEWLRFLGVGPWVALAVLESLIAGLLGPLLVLVEGVAGQRAGLRATGFVGAVLAVEGLRARVPFGGLTWGRLAFGQSEGPLLPWAALGGAPLVSAAVALTAAGLLELARRRPARTVRPRQLALPVLLVLLPLAGVAVPTPVDGPLVQVAAVQGNTPGAGLDAFAEDLVVLDNHVRQTERLAAEVRAGQRPRPDLVVWPENAADQDPRREPQSRARVQRAVEALGQPLLLGAILDEGGGRVSNGLLVWGRDGVEGTPYRKRHLVPFGEYLPLRSLAERVYPAARTLLARDFQPGKRRGLLRLQGVPLAVGTCFEVAFDDLPRAGVLAGGQLLVLPSNNASYGRSAQSAQQLAMARLRAVEHSRSTVVAATSGISALIAPDGRVLQRSGHYEAALLQAALPKRTRLTIATRFGPFVELLLVLLPGAVLTLIQVRRRGTTRTTRSGSAEARTPHREDGGSEHDQRPGQDNDPIRSSSTR